MEDGGREIWIDNVKIFACVLVVLGHFFQSMVKSGIIAENTLAVWFDETIYCFHVQLFFICSGYLFQRKDSVQTRGRIVAGKALTLGVPYFTFSTVTWMMKNIFSEAVNSSEGGLFQTLVLKPVSPYWYLYTLFLCFLISPRIKNIKTGVIIFSAALVAKLFVISGIAVVPYMVRNLMSYEIWFVAGMLLKSIHNRECCILKKTTLLFGTISGVVFLGLRMMMFLSGTNNSLWTEFGLGILACIAVLIFIGVLSQKAGDNVLSETVGRYVFPIFLMHTIFAAGLRSVLMKIGIVSVTLHVIAGIFISFAGPVIAMNIFEKLKWPVFFVYPNKRSKHEVTDH